ncbi:MAG TPA: energy-coupling factor transporter transmembrane component T [Thermoplasmata archaeon]|nr:energy-coupling factor transporter transmembrane component T [Thermoplasmata archaeon]
MKHNQIDEFSGRSPLSKVDPRTKFLALIALLIVASLATAPEVALAFGLFSLALAAISRIPVKHLLVNMAIVVPFATAVALSAIIIGRPESAIPMVIRMTGSVLIAIVIATTTPVFDQIRALQGFHLPNVFTSMLLFAYRFIFVFVDELERMKLARIARGFSLKRGHILKKRTMDTIAQTLGMLFIRVNQRAVRVFDSLRSRGYSGIAVVRRPLALGLADVLFMISTGGVIMLLSAIQLKVVL